MNRVWKWRLFALASYAAEAAVLWVLAGLMFDLAPDDWRRAGGAAFVWFVAGPVLGPAAWATAERAARDIALARVAALRAGGGEGRDG